MSLRLYRVLLAVLPDYLVELGELGVYHARLVKVAVQGLLRLQAVSGYRDHYRLVLLYPALLYELFRNADSNSAGGLGKDALGLGQKLHALYYLRVGDIIGPAS